LAEFLDVAREAALQAGKLVLANLHGTQEVRYKGEGHKNPASQIDEQAEEIIINTISSHFPEHGFISEERGAKNTASDYTWIIDPLDGTVNYIHRYRLFGTSIALSCKGDIILGVVYNPCADEMFTAVKGKSAFLNGEGIRVSAVSRLDECLLAMGFPYDRNSEAFSSSIRRFARLVKDGQALRRDGSTALDLCHVACGRFDGFCVAGNELWDYAAGTLIVTEAGGRVTDFQGNESNINNDRSEVLTTSGLVHDMILSRFQDESAD